MKLTLTVLTLVVLAFAEPVEARPQTTDRRTIGVPSERVVEGRPRPRSGTPGSAVGGTRVPPPDLRYVDSFGLCFASGPVVLPGVENPIAWQMPGCPVGPSAPVQPVRPPPRAAALAAWWQTTLPDPAMAMSPPGVAITGLDLYLSIGGPQRLTFDVASLGYSVHLEVGSVYDVDWGDPSPDGSVLGARVTRGHRTQGGLWPNGDLRHQYIERGSATIKVTQRWTARWTAGGESGTISDVLYTEAATTIPVQEIQAVLLP